MGKPLILCDATCSICGDGIGMEYKNEKTIESIKKKTKGWIWSEATGISGNLCPQCQKKYKEVLKKYCKAVPRIWCEAAECKGCGKYVGMWHEGAKTAKMIKEATEGWKYDMEVSGNLCLDCQKKRKGT